MTSAMKDVSPEYYEDPSSRPITLSFETCNDETLDEIALCTALTMLFHYITKYRRERGTERTGKPESALQIAYHPPPGSSASLQTCCEEEYSSRIDASTSPATYYLYASDFWQRRHCVNDILWPSLTIPQRMISTDASRHPVRPVSPDPGTLIYQRFIPTFTTTLSLRVISMDQIDMYAAWQDSDRVNQFWNEKGPREKHIKYVSTQLADPHVLPLIGSFGDEAFAYFEVYYAKEDHIAPHASPGDWDRGFHALVGNTAFRGPERVRIWINSLAHYLFLADHRTQRVMLEPRVDNHVFIRYLLNAGFSIEKEFNFPHKRSALVSITREKFFESHGVET